ncbi:MAG: uL15 family ribosomal protein [Candidatus Micrarchaeota archaeon]|nr:uL15 family ribosomal protein [Candidatus Micrarchaeota archaeon]
MVVRREKRNRKYYGSRRWGVGNIKNARGKQGSRGLAGRGLGTGSKHNFTYVTAYEPELIRKVGFTPWNQRKLKSISLREVERLLSRKDERVIELGEYKVLSNGTLSAKATIKAARFSKAAEEKIKSAGGEAVKI